VEIVLKSDSQNFLKPLASVQPCAGILYIIQYTIRCWNKIINNFTHLRYLVPVISKWFILYPPEFIFASTSFHSVHATKQCACTERSTMICNKQKENFVDFFSVIHVMMLGRLFARSRRTKNMPHQLWFSELRCSKNKIQYLVMLWHQEKLLLVHFSLSCPLLSQVFVKRGSPFYEHEQSCYSSLVPSLQYSSQDVADEDSREMSPFSYHWNFYIPR